MLISMHVMRPGIDFEPATGWPEPGTDESSKNDWVRSLTTARGIFYGVALSCVFWAALIVGIQTLIQMLA